MAETGNFSIRGAFVDKLFECIQKYNGTALMSESDFEVSQSAARLISTFKADGTFNYHPYEGTLYHVNFHVDIDDSIEEAEMYIAVRVQLFDPNNLETSLRSNTWSYAVDEGNFVEIAAEHAFVHIHGLATGKE